VSLIVFGSWIGDQIAIHAGSGSAAHVLWVGLRWPVIVILLVAAVGVFFAVAPSVRQKWYSALPGALFAVGAVIGTSAMFSWFVSQKVLQVRWLTYGAVGTAIVLLFWAFLCGLMLLIGSEINAAVRRSVAARREAKKALVESADHE